MDELDELDEFLVHRESCLSNQEQASAAYVPRRSSDHISLYRGRKLVQPVQCQKDSHRAAIHRCVWSLQGALIVMGQTTINIVQPNLSGFGVPGDIRQEAQMSRSRRRKLAREEAKRHARVAARRAMLTPEIQAQAANMLADYRKNPRAIQRLPGIEGEVAEQRAIRGGQWSFDACPHLHEVVRPRIHDEFPKGTVSNAYDHVLLIRRDQEGNHDRIPCRLLHIAPVVNGVQRFTVLLQDGTIRESDFVCSAVR